jgi:hypothetical protein
VNEIAARAAMGSWISRALLCGWDDGPSLEIADRCRPRTCPGSGLTVGALSQFLKVWYEISYGDVAEC